MEMIGTWWVAVYGLPPKVVCSWRNAASVLILNGGNTIISGSGRSPDGEFRMASTTFAGIGMGNILAGYMWLHPIVDRPSDLVENR